MTERNGKDLQRQDAAAGVFFLGSMVGALAGAAAALLLAPQAGDDTQAQLRAYGDQLREEAEGKMTDGRRLVDARVGTIRDAVADWLEQGSQLLGAQAKNLRS